MPEQKGGSEVKMEDARSTWSAMLIFYNVEKGAGIQTILIKIMPVKI